jgi:hypothetical protein
MVLIQSHSVSAAAKAISARLGDRSTGALTSTG